MGKKENGLYAIIEPFDEFTIIESASAIKKLAEKHYKIDVAIAELPSEILKRIGDLTEIEYPLQFCNVGHISMVLNYLNGEHIPLNYGDISQIGGILNEVILDMKKKEQKIAYQICTGKNKEKLEDLLRRSFTLLR